MIEWNKLNYDDLENIQSIRWALKDLATRYIEQIYTLIDDGLDTIEKEQLNFCKRNVRDFLAEFTRLKEFEQPAEEFDKVTIILNSPKKD